MTDVLLIQPPIRDFYLTVKRTIPYGLACIASVLIDEGYSVDIVDGLARSKSRVIALPEELSYLKGLYGPLDRSPFALFHGFKHFGFGFDHIGEIARGSGALLIGISSLFTPYAADAIKTAETVKRFYPSCKIVMGGHHPTAMPQSVMKSQAVDFILRGEGEVSMPLLVGALAGKRSVRGIPGIVYRRSDGGLFVGEPVSMKDPDRYPPPAMHLIDHRFYRRAGRGGVVVMTSRGCPMKCSYCCVGSSCHWPYRRKSIDSVLSEIETAVRCHGAGFIDFEDENLSLDRTWFLGLLKGIAERFENEGIELRAMNGLYPPTLDPEVIAAMKRAGFKTLNLSLGSTSARQLKRFHRPEVGRDFDRAIRLCETSGMQAVGYIIIGAPGQDPETSLADLLFLARRRVLAGVSVFYPAPGSLDFERCKRLGVLPAFLSCMRSSALPIDHTTSRLETVTLLRLGRILNFIKSLIHKEASFDQIAAGEIKPESPDERINNGVELLRRFMDDGRVRGVDSHGDVFEHRVSERLVRRFIDGLRAIRVRGCG